MSQTIIIGGGLAGLTAARQLQQQGKEFMLFEATDRIGGRVKTDVEDGYRFDRGFQVLLTAYPEVQRWLDYEQLDLKHFLPGALLLMENGSQNRIGDPLRDWSSLFPTVFSSAGSISDKLKILSLKNRLDALSIEAIFQQKECSSREALVSYGFSEKMIQRFFEPFFAGIFLEKELKTSRRMFDFVFKMFGEGYAAIPDLGMEEIPKQLAEPIKQYINTNSKIERIEGQTVHLSNGRSYTAEHIILATEATGLVNAHHTSKAAFQSTLHVHFAAQKPPIQKPIIALNTNKNRLANNICVINTVAPSYAPKGKYLISISVVGNPKMPEKELLEKLKKELTQWFGKETEDWEHLKTQEVTYALPNQSQVRHHAPVADFKIRDGLYAAGDWMINGSLNAAMMTGRMVAEAIER